MRSAATDAKSVAPGRAAAALLLALCVGCATTGSVDPTASSNPEVAASGQFSARVAAFSADRAWRDLQALSEIGARPVGSRGNQRARDYLGEQLEELGVEVEIWEVDYAKPKAGSPGADSATPSVRNLSAILPGTQSQDRIVLVAPFDSQSFENFEFIGANDGASGAAVVLEVARAIRSHPLPYATEIVLLDGESPFRLPDERPGFHREVGSFGLASRLAAEGVSGTRLIVYLNRVGDADLRIARDLMSHRIYREEFWKAAATLGRDHAFSRDAVYESVGVSQSSFAQIGLRQIVSIVDTSFGGDQPPGLYAGTVDDTIERCAPESLETVGMVVLEALDAISTRLAKIDRFAGSQGSDAAVHGLPRASMLAQ